MLVASAADTIFDSAAARCLDLVLDSTCSGPLVTPAAVLGALTTSAVAASSVGPTPQDPNSPANPREEGTGAGDGAGGGAGRAFALIGTPYLSINLRRGDDVGDFVR